MPSFTITSPDLAATGPVVDLAIGLHTTLQQQLITAGQPIPSPVSATAMVDTGASSSVIQAGLASSLGLQPVSTTTINTPASTNVVCPVYAVNIALPNGVGGDVFLIEAPLQGQHIQALIGRDILANAVLVYIGYANSWTLSF